jgi:hypothetical protein
MNSIMESYYPVFGMYQSLRDQMMQILEDTDLQFSLEGDNPNFGALCREMGEVQYCYINSFQTFQMDLSYKVNRPELERSVEQLVGWYSDLDRKLDQAVSNLSQEDIDSRKIDRGGDFVISPLIQLEVYKEALLIFYGKSSVYLKALGKELPDQWREWIA